ncbi:uncharacterized protein LAESUDRAFT_744990 [Laetiporus sulphureus 93-53]|uniref:NAD(P)-binding domain-containing protein n=1 Tax=Laetiporus sulphureus 93-53 TaxID=1314785 RepID=A0A165CDL5_9APHY|nr:uncharacterized protein LAESUDRAFT_744990 [Laetiporus sulphureus 93-53]KZT02619.1 hypothetical protein LAESUDRAFT_744990 [Laetiporus sulphureus 93-53]
MAFKRASTGRRTNLTFHRCATHVSDFCSGACLFIFHCTGYIGGFVLTRFLLHPKRANFDVVTRKLEEMFGLRTVIGSLDDAGRPVELASGANVVIACADADNLPAWQAMLKGMTQRYQEMGEVLVLIHTPHRNVDLAALDAEGQGSVFGLVAYCTLVDAGLMERHSQQIPQPINASLDCGQTGTVGKGKNFWPNVNTDEVADLYLIILDHFMAGKLIGHGREGFYIGENGEHMLYDISKATGEAMMELGKLDKYFGGSDFLGSNVCCRAERSRSIEWKPVKTTLASIKQEMQAMIEHPEGVKST